jgi:hypothetical protein
VSGVPGRTVHLQELYVAKAFQEALFRVPAGRRVAALRLLLPLTDEDGPTTTTVQDAIRSNLMKAGKPGYVEETRSSFQDAYRLILALKGIPCHPILGDGVTPECPFESDVEALGKWLRAQGVYCAELIPARNTAGSVGAYAAGLRAAGIILLGGTEHNGNDVPSLAPRCRGGLPLPDGAPEMFWEGACVVAAHQFLTANAHPGYVDDEGCLHPSYKTDDARIVAFARLGAWVIENYGRLAGC